MSNYSTIQLRNGNTLNIPRGADIAVEATPAVRQVFYDGKAHATDMTVDEIFDAVGDKPSGGCGKAAVAEPTTPKKTATKATAKVKKAATKVDDGSGDDVIVEPKGGA